MIAQASLKAVSVDIDFKGTTVVVRQQFSMMVPDSVQKIHLKALEFKGTEFKGVIAANGIKPVKVEEQLQDGLRQLALSSDVGFDEITISYQLQIGQGILNLPLFFTELPAVPSKTDFFRMKMQMPEGLRYNLYFPGVPVEEQTHAGVKTVQLQVPALPSLIRMELFYGEKETRLMDIVDIMVAFLFVGIGLLIWKYRKRLAYG